jgi:protein O-mannosyl-transferase
MGAPEAFQPSPARSKNWSLPVVASQPEPTLTMSCLTLESRPAPKAGPRSIEKRRSRPNARLLAWNLFLILATLKKLSRAWAILLIITATFLVYWPALRNGFVWDDTALVLRDPLIRSWVLIPEGFRHFLFIDATASNFYRPIQRLTFVADYQFFGFGWPGGWHLTSVLIHAGAAMALFFLAEKLLGLALAARLGDGARRAWALGVALLWAIHPLHTSAVTYVAGRADPLAALFGFAALALGLTSLEQPRRVWLWRLGAAAGFALAILSKESGGTFLLVWVLALIWRRPNRREVATWVCLMAVVVGGYCALRFTAHKTPPPPAPPTPAAVRPILAARAVAEYASLIVAPVTLRMERDVSTNPRESFEATMKNARLREYQTLAGVLLTVGFVLWVGWAWWCSSSALFCLCAFAVAYVPISNALPLNATVAEHWLYVASAFLLLAAVLTALGFRAQKSVFLRSASLRTTGEGEAAPLPARDLADENAGSSGSNLRVSAPLRFVLIGLAVVWVVFLGVRTFFRQDDWRDQRTFIERTIAAGGNSPRMMMNLANVESGAGRHDKAIALYREALRRSPEQPIIWMGYASILARARNVTGAREALARAESSPLLKAECLQLRASLAQADGSGDPDQLLREAVAANPTSWPVRKRYVEARARKNDVAQALRELAGFVSAHPFRAESWKLLGQIFEAAGDRERARDAYHEASARDVHDAESEAAWERLSTTRSNAGNR